MLIFEPHTEPCGSAVTITDVDESDAVVGDGAQSAVDVVDALVLVDGRPDHRADGQTLALLLQHLDERAQQAPVHQVAPQVHRRRGAESELAGPPTQLLDDPVGERVALDRDPVLARVHGVDVDDARWPFRSRPAAFTHTHAATTHSISSGVLLKMEVGIRKRAWQRA